MNSSCAESYNCTVAKIYVPQNTTQSAPPPPQNKSSVLPPLQTMKVVPLPLMWRLSPTQNLPQKTSKVITDAGEINKILTPNY